MGKKNKRLLGKQVWCQTCNNKKPQTIKRSDFLIPVRKKPYDLKFDGSEIDRRVHGVCIDCLIYKDKFQQINTQRVDINHKHLVYTEH